MHSKIIAFVSIIIIAAFAACSDGKSGAQAPRIGVPLQQAYSVFTGSVGTAYEQNEAVYLDSDNRQVILFQVEPFKVTDVVDLPSTVDATAFFAGKNNAFFLLKEKRGFGILKRAGGYVKNPIPMFGEITAVSYDAASHRLVIQDSLESVALARLNDDGDVVASWIGGPVIDGENTILAGTLLRNGVIAVSMSDGKMARIDFDGSLNAGGWRFDTFTLPELAAPVEKTELFAHSSKGKNSYASDDEFDRVFTSSNKPEPQGLYWLSPVDSDSHSVIARTAKAIYMIDFDQSVVTDTLTLAAGESGLHFNRNTGHVIVSNAGLTSHQLVHAGTDGKLVKKKIHNVAVSDVQLNRNVEFSVMDTPTGSLTVMARLNNTLTILRNRLVDGLFVGAVDVGEFERTVVTDRYVIEILDYKLGKAVRTEIQNPDNTSEIKAYNIQHGR